LAIVIIFRLLVSPHGGGRFWFPRSGYAAESFCDPSFASLLATICLATRMFLWGFGINAAWACHNWPTRVNVTATRCRLPKWITRLFSLPIKAFIASFLSFRRTGRQGLSNTNFGLIHETAPDSGERHLAVNAVNRAADRLEPGRKPANPPLRCQGFAGIRKWAADHVAAVIDKPRLPDKHDLARWAVLVADLSVELALHMLRNRSHLSSPRM
jgi:hypothetical protein